MKLFNFKKIAFIVLGALFISLTATSCSKSGTKPGTGTDSGGGASHYVDPKLVGEWMWTDGSDAYYDDDGVYHGAAYGFATKF